MDIKTIGLVEEILQREEKTIPPEKSKQIVESLKKFLADNQKVTGWLEIFKNGQLVQATNNLVVIAGKNHIADQLSDQGEGAMSHMAVGTGSTAPAAGDTALETELDRNVLTSATQTDNAILYIGDWAAGDGTGALTEAGIFNDDSSSVMLCRATFGTVTKEAADVIQIRWTLTVN